MIVSKTDLKGKITYANRVFLRVSGYDKKELIGAPHNILRHPNMPRAVFKLLWDTLQKEKEIFAYVLNRCRNGDHYWVLAHVTPSWDNGDHVVAYHSNRRLPERKAVEQISSIYNNLLAIEQKHSSPKDGLDASLRALHELLQQKGMPYEQFVLSF